MRRLLLVLVLICAGCPGEPPPSSPSEGARPLAPALAPEPPAADSPGAAGPSNPVSTPPADPEREARSDPGPLAKAPEPEPPSATPLPEKVLNSSSYRRLRQSFETLEADLKASRPPARVARNAKRVAQAIDKLARKFPEFDPEPSRARLRDLRGANANADNPEPRVARSGQEAKSYFRRKSQDLEALFDLGSGGALKTFEANLKKLDLAALRSALEANRGLKSPFYTQVERDLADLGGLLRRSSALAYLTQGLATAQAAASRGDPLEARRGLSSLEPLLERLAGFVPQSKELQALRRKGTQLKDRIRAQLGERFSSPFHVAHVGQLVFSKVVLDLSRAHESDVLARLPRGAPIYATALLNKPLQDLSGDGRYVLLVAIDGGERVRYELVVPKGQRGEALVRLAITPSEAWLKREGARLSKAEWVLLQATNRALSALKGQHTLSLTLRGLGPRDLSATLSLDLSAGARLQREAALLATDQLSRDNVLPGVGLRNPELEKSLLGLTKKQASFRGLAVRRVLLLDRTWKRVYTKGKVICGRKRSLGVVVRDASRRYQLVWAAVEQRIDAPTKEIYNPAELVDALFKRHPMVLTRGPEEPRSLSEEAAQAEVRVRKVIGLTPVNVLNGLSEPIRVQSGGQRQTFAAGARGSFLAEIGESVEVRSSGGRLIKSFSADQVAKTGRVALP